MPLPMPRQMSCSIVQVPWPGAARQNFLRVPAFFLQTPEQHSVPAVQRMPLLLQAALTPLAQNGTASTPSTPPREQLQILPTRRFLDGGDGACQRIEARSIHR